MGAAGTARTASTTAAAAVLMGEGAACAGCIEQRELACDVIALTLGAGLRSISLLHAAHKLEGCLAILTLIFVDWHWVSVSYRVILTVLFYRGASRKSIFIHSDT